MKGNKRRDEIKNLIDNHTEVKIEDLANKFNVSGMTIRRDLSQLEEEGLIVKTLGGAVNKNINNNETPYYTKNIKNIIYKKQIGEKAKSLIEDNHTIFLDAGTTCLSIAKKIKDKKITVITNDIFVILELFQCSNLEIICIGGKIQNKVGAIVGNKIKNDIGSFYVDFSFVGTHSLSGDELYLSTPTIEKVAIKNEIISIANRSILVTDHTKFNKKSSFKICHLSKFDYFITDDEIEEGVLKFLKSNAENVHIL